MKNYEIFANHAHVFQRQVREEGTVEELLRVMDICGISRAVAFAPFHKYFDDSRHKNPNRWLAEAIRGNSRLYGFGVIDLAGDDPAGQVHEAKQLGLVGLKLHPAFQKFPPVRLGHPGCPNLATYIRKTRAYALKRLLRSRVLLIWWVGC